MHWQKEPTGSIPLLKSLKILYIRNLKTQLLLIFVFPNERGFQKSKVLQKLIMMPKSMQHFHLNLENR